MADLPLIVSIPWYRRGDYEALLALFSDSEKLPRTFDAWLLRAEGFEKQAKSAGRATARIYLRPMPFAAWCKERDLSPDGHARRVFASEGVGDLNR
ncbi:hypothetical protein [Reyranella sp.]|uniref:hypothetical protein n=1 Tax=Reyranella sp. TaxID=1929291 RepID=UPI003C7AB04F